MGFSLTHTGKIKNIVSELNETNIATNKEKYDELIHSLFNIILAQFTEFRDHMETTKNAYSLNDESYRRYRREITLIGSEIRALTEEGIDRTTLNKIHKLYFEALNIYSTYVNIGIYI